MKNYAGNYDADGAIAKELEEAGIHVEKLPEFTREKHPEMRTVVMGSLHGWSFRRAWTYWIADGPGIPPSYANTLHDEHGKEVRVAGHCGCPSPLDWYKGFAVPLYHVDSQAGLNALADTIKKVVADAKESEDGA
jgi:hypothetical protein